MVQSASSAANGVGLPSPSEDGHSEMALTPPASPKRIRDTLKTMNGMPRSSSTPEDQTSEEDYDDIRPSATVIRRRPTGSMLKQETAYPEGRDRIATSEESSKSRGSPVSGANQAEVKHSLRMNDQELREVLHRGLLHTKDPAGKGRPKFRDLVFTRTFSAFDRQNQDAASSPFHGFFTLFWMAVFLFMVKMGVDNWDKYGNPLGRNEIMKSMFDGDVILLLLSDGIMCGLTGVSWVIQRLIYAGYLDWDSSGLAIQSLWQVIFIFGAVGLTRIRQWPWSHTVFFVLHGIVMLMKQHSYAFYNGYLSTIWKTRGDLLRTLKQLEKISPVQTTSTTEPLPCDLYTTHLSRVPSAQRMKERRLSLEFEKNVPDIDRIAAAIDSGDPLDQEQVQVFERIIKWEVDALTDELCGKSSSPEKAYPNNLTLRNHYEYIVLPTVVYELEYPRSDSINWFYAAEKLAACFGIIFVMIMVSQAFIYPVVMRTLQMKEENMPLSDRFREFPWMLKDLIFPFMMEYLLSWYLIWETILNLLAELTYFADRTFYGAWWNSVSWDQFARDWNRPVHNFLLRHVYHSSISAMKVNKHTATLITFFLSACIHELVMWCIFKKLRGYLLILQMLQLPLVRLSRTKWLRNKATLGNMIFWLGIFTGPSVLCSLYLIL